MSVVANWDHPLFVVIGSMKHAVRNATDASWLLADRWPVLAGEPFMRALKACAAEREGKAGTCARTAFVAAARDADIEVRSPSLVLVNVASAVATAMSGSEKPVADMVPGVI